MPANQPRPESALRFLRKHEVWIFLVSIVIANAIFVSSVVYGHLPTGVYSMGRFALLGGLLFGMVYLSRGWAGIAEILRPLCEWRRSPALYAAAVLWTVVICLLVLFGKGVATGEHLTVAMVQEGLRTVAQPKLLATLLVSSFIGEMVWVSYAVRRLSQQMTLFMSAVVVGAVWTAWWLPMSVHNFGIIPDLPLIALLFNQTGIAAMCAFVYHHTRSGLLVLVMQFMFNAAILVFPVTPGVGGSGTYWAFALAYFSAATALFAFFGPKPMLLGNGIKDALARDLASANSAATGRTSGSE